MIRFFGSTISKSFINKMARKICLIRDAFRVTNTRRNSSNFTSKHVHGDFANATKLEWDWLELDLYRNLPQAQAPIEFMQSTIKYMPIWVTFSNLERKYCNKEILVRVNCMQSMQTHWRPL